MPKLTINAGIVFSLLPDLFKHHLSAHPSLTTSSMIYCLDLNQTTYSLSSQQKVSYSSKPGNQEEHFLTLTSHLSHRDVCILYSVHIMSNYCKQCQKVVAPTNSRSLLGENISTHAQTYTQTRPPGCHRRRDKRHNRSMWKEKNPPLLTVHPYFAHLKVKHGNAPVMLCTLNPNYGGRYTAQPILTIEERGWFGFAESIVISRDEANPRAQVGRGTVSLLYS